MNFGSNVNFNKFGCGNIHFSNNLAISINNSNFTNNINESNGGVL